MADASEFSSTYVALPGMPAVRVDQPPKLDVIERRPIKATYDSAQSTRENTKHWARSDALSADAGNSAGVRKLLRERARYEAQQNNSIAKGIVLTLANDTIGTGPRLQVITEDRDVNSQIERRFSEWAIAMRLAEKLRTMRISKCVDGEAFAHFGSNERLESPVQLDLVVDECDRYQSPFVMIDDPLLIDGVRFNEFGTPISYERLRFHPGSNFFGGNAFDFDTMAAEFVIHLFRADRAEQHRGISELAPALALFSQWRRYKLACLGAAETAADFAAIMKTQGPPQNVDEIPTDVAFEIEPRVLVDVPKGWDVVQMKSEQPPTTLEMFERSIIQEMARALNVPFNVASGSSAGYNFASGKLDYQIYGKAIAVERNYWEINCLDRILAAWLREAAVIPGFMPDGLELLQLPHQWFWDDVRPDLDPVKTANGVATELRSGITTLPREYARRGLDWEVQQERGAQAMGLSLAEYRAKITQGIFGSAAAEPTSDGDTEGDQTEDVGETTTEA